eukprot:gnl/TRDRNA2_/TRDRNA2_144677_c0_seq1.p1 gnl/TRDRNA2_/TRDRNA2_144677_c0~~gnl/TRDRNA2_/TRDRNA2_144677_c0_seq1.p1  ORF type:complete len:113 (+),score=3.95 gnl/TRDRNA2_/TRDRNA2_144677_c0_seq1:128-466(+)
MESAAPPKNLTYLMQLSNRIWISPCFFLKGGHSLHFNLITILSASITWSLNSMQDALGRNTRRFSLHMIWMIHGSPGYEPLEPRCSEPQLHLGQGQHSEGNHVHLAYGEGKP